DRWVLSPRGQQKLSPGGDRSLLLQLEEGEIPDASLELENLPIRILPAEDGDAARAGDAGQSPGEAGDPSALRLIELTYVPEQNLVGVPGITPGSAAGFLPLLLAFAFFVQWSIAGAGQPTTMVRL